MKKYYKSIIVFIVLSWIAFLFTSDLWSVIDVWQLKAFLITILFIFICIISWIVNIEY